MSDIRQSNAEYVVTSLHQIPTGEKWTQSKIKERVNLIKRQNSKLNINLKWNVVESIPVHNNIKLREKNFRKLINNYKDTISNIAKNKIYTVCYNFMPIVDWTRTQLDFKLSTDGLALRFNYLHIIIFEKYILKLKNLEGRYTSKQIISAEKLFKKMKLKELNDLKYAVMGGLPAAEKKYSIKEFKEMLLAYKDFKDEDLRNNLKYFLKEIIPVAEENKIKMALHPDDPPLPLFGVPRIVSSLEDYKSILNSYDSHSNGVTFCAGSLASNIKNNVYEIFKNLRKLILYT